MPFKTYIDILAGYCHNTTAAKWTGVLEVQMYTVSENAYLMIDSLRIDYNDLGPFGIPPEQ